MTASTYVLTNGKKTIVTYPYSIGQMMEANPTVSFPIPVPDEVAAEYNVFPVEDVAQPTYDQMTQNLTLDNPVLQGGVWTQKWSVSDASESEKAARLASMRSGLSCSPLQGKIALHNDGLLDEAEAAVLAADKVTQIAWANATVWMRTSNMIETLGAQLNLTADDLDILFKAAQQITV